MIHLCNTFFEKELETSSPKSLVEWLRSHPAILQLQFLPLLYAGPNDTILVSDLPENPDPRLRLIDQPTPVEHWGPSLAIAKWAKLPPPNWSHIQQINSKVFSYLNSPKLPGSELLHTQVELDRWLAQTPGPKVLKTPFGTSANGHFHIGKRNTPTTWPLIAEPWVTRLYDFSTQWKNGKLLGVTRFENEESGTYRKTTLDPVEPWALEEHLAIATPLIEKLNYNDHVGIDAFVYLHNNKPKLHPIVEINARKTMSWVALQIQKPIAYCKSETGLLPSQLKVGNKIIRFTRNLISC